MFTAKAPTGGLVSPVNGRFYEGGEFMPDHGHYCGKGKYKVTEAEFNELAEKVKADGKTLKYDKETETYIVMYFGGNICYRAKNLKTLAKCF